MASSLRDDLLEALSHWLARQTGLYFPEERWTDLDRGIAAAARDLQLADAESYARTLIASGGSHEEIEGIVRHLTVGETYFFRHRPSIEALRFQALPALIRSRRQSGRTLRFWSAGCCTGEEPYSLAILLQQVLPDWRNWNITILATDINDQFLERARLGHYRGWSFRETDAEFQKRYFRSPQKDHFEILPDVKAMVTFRYFNLAAEGDRSHFADVQEMDLILCRNVLMYFSPEHARKTMQRLYGCLAPDGWLMVSPSEASHTLMADFAAPHSPGATLYAKQGTEAAGVPAPMPQETAVWSHVARADAVVEVPVAGVTGAREASQSQEATQSLDALTQVETPVSLPEASSSVRSTFSGEAQARALYERGDIADAIARLEDVLAGNPHDAPAMMLLARIRANQGALSGALAWCEKAIAADKLNPGAHYLRAAILQEDGRPGEAVASLERALYLDPGFVLAHFSLGNLCQRQGNHAGSMRHFRNALRALRACPADVALPESDGITPERLTAMIESALASELENAR